MVVCGTNLFYKNEIVRTFLGGGLFVFHEDVFLGQRQNTFVGGVSNLGPVRSWAGPGLDNDMTAPKTSPTVCPLSHRTQFQVAALFYLSFRAA